MFAASVFSFYVEWRAQYDFRHYKTTYLRNFLMLFIHTHALSLSPSFVNKRRTSYTRRRAQTIPDEYLFRTNDDGDVEFRNFNWSLPLETITQISIHLYCGNRVMLAYDRQVTRRKSSEAKWQMAHFAFHILRSRAHWNRNAGDGVFFSFTEFTCRFDFIGAKKWSQPLHDLKWTTIIRTRFLSKHSAYFNLVPA